MPGLDTTLPTVHLELPLPWVAVPLAADGDRRGQRALLADWCGRTPPDDLVARLVRESRDAHRAGLAFAAVLLATVDGHGTGVQRVAVTAALTVGVQRFPGADDPRVAAEGVLQLRRAARGPAARLEVVGLGGDPERPAVVGQESVTDARCEVLWLVPGTDLLVGIAATSQDRPLGPALAQVALAAAGSLRLA